MSDPLSIVGSVAGVIALGGTIAKGLYQIADEMGSAGIEVRVYAGEIDAFAKLLFGIRHTVDGLTCLGPERSLIQSSVDEILSNCDRILQPLRDIQEALLPLLQHFRDSPSKMRQVALRVRWTFASKDKVFFCRDLPHRQRRMRN